MKTLEYKDYVFDYSEEIAEYVLAMYRISAEDLAKEMIDNYINYGMYIRVFYTPDKIKFKVEAEFKDKKLHLLIYKEEF